MKRSERRMRTAHRRGESHPRVKYTDAQISEARFLRLEQGRPHAEISMALGMPVSYVRKVTTWNKR